MAAVRAAANVYNVTNAVARSAYQLNGATYQAFTALRTTIRDNTVDASVGITGIDLWGFAQGVAVTGDTVTGPLGLDTAEFERAAIRFVSLSGVIAVGSLALAPCGRIALTDGVTVQHNRIGWASPKVSDRILFESRDCSGRKKHYTPRHVVNSGSAQPTAYVNR
jgi:hypothetical protein